MDPSCAMHSRATPSIANPASQSKAQLPNSSYQQWVSYEHPLKPEQKHGYSNAPPRMARRPKAPPEGLQFAR